MNPASQTLTDCVGKAVGVTSSQFLDKHNHPVLVWYQELEGIEETNFQFETSVIEPEDAQALSTPRKIRSQLERTFVMEIKKRVTTTPANMICVGRASNNDIIIPDRAVSKLHAYFLRQTTDDSYLLIDANSTNGTEVNGRRLIANQGHSLVNQDHIQFGASIQVRYFTPQGFYAHLQELLRSGYF